MDGIRNFQNRLLGSMPEADRLLLEPHMSFVDLPLKMRLQPPNTPIESCFFPSEGIASVVATGKNGKTIEVGLIGREGMTGSVAILGGSPQMQSSCRSPATDTKLVSATSKRR
jgi:CRP-like cAMP-binding protein